MEWVFIAGLGVWVWLQSQRIDAQRRRLRELERRIAALEPSPARNMQPVSPVPDPLLLDTPPVSEAEERAPEAPPVAANAEEPLVLDMPLPDVSNDTDDEIAAPPPQPALVLTQIVPPEEVAPPFAPTPIPAPPAPPPPPPRVRQPRALERWIAENGLAWLAGVSFTLGAAFLVTVAAQQAWFTPGVQLTCASILGLALLGASEWVRQAPRRRQPGHPLLAALLAGAGIAAFYLAIWAAHAQHHYLTAGQAVALLAICSLALVALSALHGQALGVLAIAAALIAPALTGVNVWPPYALTIYVCAIGAAGFALGMLRLWPWVAVATLGALYFWFAAAIAEDQVRRALALLSFGALGGVAMAFRLTREDDASDYKSWRTLRTYVPAIAISVSSVLMFWPWLATTPAPGGLIAGPAWVSAMFVALAAASIRARVAPASVVVVAIAALVIGFAAYLQARVRFGPVGDDFYPFVLFAAFVAGASALGARPPRTDWTLVSGAGAIGAALLIVLAAFSRSSWHALQAWAPLFVGGALLLVAASRAERRAHDKSNDRALDLWVTAGAALLLLGVESAVPAAARTVAHAGMALLFAALLVWRGWGGLRFTALLAATIAIGQALSPALIGPAVSGAMSVWLALAIIAGTATLLFGAAFLVMRTSHRATAEALSSAGVIAILIGVFLALRSIASGGVGAPITAFTEHALRAVALMAAGHIVMAQADDAAGRIGRWRGHVLLGFGLIYALNFAGLSLNPWWGPFPATIAGAPLFNTLLLAFAAPAAFAGFAAYRLYDRMRTAARIYAAASGMFALAWAALELRRLFHVDAMATAPVGVFEGACYGLLFLASALGVAIAARWRAADGPFAQDLARVTRGVAWGGLGIGALILLIARHPWWGGQDALASAAVSTGLAVLAQLVAVALSLLLGRALSFSQKAEPTRFSAAAAAIVFMWSFGHAAIRWLYHQGAMDDGVALAGLEGFAHALWPLALVLGAAEASARAPHRDTIRPYLHDLQAICATAIWPALAFAGLGFWLMFNPWWGIAPAQATGAAAALFGLMALLLAAAMSFVAPRVQFARWPQHLQRAAVVACAAHLFVALTMVVRWLYHPGDMAEPAPGQVELWTYSAVWALFGAGALAWGTIKDDVVARWIGLVVLIGTTLKVFVVDMARLSGVVRAASALGLAAVLALSTWWVRRNRPPPPPPSPADLVNVTPSARRGRTRGRRYRSQ